MQRLRLVCQLAQVAAHLLSGLLQCALLFPLSSTEQMNALVQRWSARLIRIFGITLHVSGCAPTVCAVVANHVSWMDVYVINAVAPSRFLAKSEVRRWPVVGWLSARIGTIYIVRGRRADLLATNAAIARVLTEGQRVALFPEGTSARQGCMGQFHANVFQGVVASRAAVQPVAIAYFGADGAPCHAAEYIEDMSLWESILRLLNHGPLVAHVSFLARIDSATSERRVLAGRTHQAVAGQLSVWLEKP